MVGRNHTRSLSSSDSDTRAHPFGWLRSLFVRLLLPDLVGSPDDLVGLISNASGDGVWTLDRKGNIYAFGKAPEFREVPHPDPWREEFVAIAATPSGQGVWTLDRKGNIFAFGDATEFREVPHPDPWREEFVAIAATPSGQGVWTLDRKGNILCFGDATEVPPSLQRP